MVNRLWATRKKKAITEFQARLTAGKFAVGENSAIQEIAKKTQADFRDALANDLNTAEALAAIFEMVRAGNTAIDQGQFFTADRNAILPALKRYRRGV